MSTRVLASGYDLENGLVTPVLIDKTVFQYPTGSVGVSPLTGDTGTVYQVNVTGLVDAAAAPMKSVLYVDGLSQPDSAVRGSWPLKLDSGSHSVSASLYDANGARYVTPAVQVHVDVPVPPPTPKVSIFGISHGPTPADFSAGSALNPKEIRIYDQMASNFASVAQGQKLPASVELIHISNKPGLSGLRMNDSQKATLRSLGESLPKDKRIKWSIGHETNNDLGISASLASMKQLAADYHGAWDVFDTVVDAVNAGRDKAFQIDRVNVVTGNVFDFAGGMDLWYRANAVTGFDIYQLKNIQKASFYMLAKGTAWCMPEWGIDAAAGTDSRQGDLAYCARIDGDWKFFNFCANPPTDVNWFNGNKNLIIDRPLAAGKLKKLFATGSPL